MLARSYAAWAVAAPAALWFYHDVAIAAAKQPAGTFPFLPAILTTVAVMLALHWLNGSRG